MRPRTFWHVLSTEARTRMGYRGDFWISALVGFASEFALMAFLWQAMFRESGRSRIAGFDLDGILLYYAAVLLLGKIVRGPELASGNISQDVYEGGLTRYLLFPTSYLGFKYAQNLASLLPLVLQLVLFGVWFPLLLDVPADVRIGPDTLAMGLVSVAAAHVLYFLISVPVEAVAFWADNVWSLRVAQRLATSLLGGAMLPLAVFPEAVQGALRWLPFPLLFDVPARAVLGRVETAEWLASLGLALAWALAFHALGRAIWRRGDLRYTGVGI